MKQNLGTFDSAARVIVGLAVIALGYHERSGWAALAILPLLTGALGYCPIYRRFGWDTTAQDEKDRYHPPPGSSNVTKV